MSVSTPGWCFERSSAAAVWLARIVAKSRGSFLFRLAMDGSAPAASSTVIIWAAVTGFSFMAAM